MDIACILADGFEDSEFRLPRDRLAAAGHNVVVIGGRQGLELVGMRGRERVRVQQPIDRARAQDYDGLLIPGGRSPAKLRADSRFVDLVREFDRQAKLIAAVCHGPELLITADLVRDRRLTAWPSVQDELRRAGATVLEQEVVVDGNRVTSRRPGDLDAFCREVLRYLAARAPLEPRPGL